MSETGDTQTDNKQTRGSCQPYSVSATLSFAMDSFRREWQKEAMTAVDKQIPTLWYENESGDRFIPDVALCGDDIPQGFIYQHSRFPLYVRHSVLRGVIRDEVDACQHPDTKPDFGIIDSMEGRECLHCHGYQSKQKGDEWPERWEANGAREIFAGGSSASDELVTKMVRDGMMASEAIMRASVACEGCMNVMAHESGLLWGYERGSEEHVNSRTTCELCSQK